MVKGMHFLEVYCGEGDHRGLALSPSPYVFKSHHDVDNFTEYQDLFFNMLNATQHVVRIRNAPNFYMIFIKEKWLFNENDVVS